jgi:LAO/AO transport system kinase
MSAPDKIKRDYSADELIEGIMKGNRTSLSKAITIIESTHEKHKKTSREIIERCLPHSGKSIRIGITGVPGAGKSTFINSFGKHLTSEGKKVAVLAIDPSSSISKGSILGDKTRMTELSSDSGAFIRPSPSSGTLGGVARTTRETIILCEAAGFDTIIVETVGVGQSETAVSNMVDYFLLLMIAGAGDELQGIKRGIMEMADGFVINKADGDNIKKALAAKNELSHAIHLFPPSTSGWVSKVETCSSLTHEGINNVKNTIHKYIEHTTLNGYFNAKRTQQDCYWMNENILDELKASFYNDPGVKKQMQILEQKVKNAQVSSFTAAQEIIGIYRAKMGI